MQKPLRILHIVGTMNQGGIECLLMNLYRNIDRNIIQFDFLTHSSQKAFFDDEIKDLGGKIYHVPNPFSLKSIFSYSSQLNLFFSKHQHYKIIHSHMNTFSGILLSIIKKKQKQIKARIAHSHTTCSEPLKIKTIMWRIARLLGQKGITHRLACSKDAAQWSFSLFPETSIILNNSIDTNLYKFKQNQRDSYRKHLGIENKLVIGHIGRFNAIKNHAFLLDVFDEVSKQDDTATLLLIGDGPLLDEMKEKAKSLKIDHKVIFLGNRSDVAQILSAMDVFVFPSINEGLGIVAVEAQASGLPCLVSDALPVEVKLTKELHFIRLDNNISIWAHKILNTKLVKNRELKYQEIANGGYEITKTSKWLSDFYLKIDKEIQ